MKNIITAVLLFTALIAIQSCAKKGCTNATAPNYNSSATADDGSCMDVPTSSGILGLYTGYIQDSTGSGSNIAANQQANITKIDDSHILVSSYAGGQLYDYTATITSLGNGNYSLTIPSQSSYGTTLSGSFISGNGSAANGYFIPSTKQFTSATTFTENGNLFIEYYVATHQ